MTRLYRNRIWKHKDIGKVFKGEPGGYIKITRLATDVEVCGLKELQPRAWYKKWEEGWNRTGHWSQHETWMFNIITCQTWKPVSKLAFLLEFGEAV